MLKQVDGTAQKAQCLLPRTSNTNQITPIQNHFRNPLIKSCYISSNISRPSSRLKNLIKVLTAVLQCCLVVVQLLLQVGNLR